MFFFCVFRVKMEKALQETLIAHKFMEYSVSLKVFFKDEFKSGDSAYLIPFSHILYTKRKIFHYIRDSCDFVCPKLKQCDGHKFLDYIEMLWKAICWAVEEKKVFYKYFYFHTFTLTSDAKYTLKLVKIRGWYAIPVEPKDLSHFSYSKRMSYLN